MITEFLLKVLIAGIPILFAIIVHEVAHGWVAEKLGDPTARMMGRITLNPIPHIDLVGTVILPLLLLWTGGFIFGWAKPVPVNWHNLRSPKRDMLLVAAAGPLTNLIMALIWVMVAKLVFLEAGQSDWAQFLLGMAQIGVTVNVILMILNLLPIPPLDGSKVLAGLLPNQASYFFNRIEPYGFILLIALFATGALNALIMPLFHIVMGWLEML